LLEDQGAATSWRPATRQALVGAYGRWLAYLADHACLDTTAAPADRVTPDALRAYVGLLQAGCASVTVSGYIALLSMMMQAMAPDKDWGWLRTAQARLHRRARPVRNKRPRIVPASELLQLGLDLVARAEATCAMAVGASERPDVAQAVRDFRDGFIIAFLVTRPLRQRNLIGIEIGRHLVPGGTGYILRFPAEETKNHRALELPFPVALLPILRRYLEHYRPILLGMRGGRDPRQPVRDSGAHLWISQCGMPFTAGGLQKALARHTMERFGHIVNPHLFRDCVATSVANEDPDHVRICAQILGHGSFRTTERHYIAANTLVAARNYHATIEALRADADRPLQGRRR